jgi:hypothetical protein
MADLNTVRIYNIMKLYFSSTSWPTQVTKYVVTGLEGLH